MRNTKFTVSTLLFVCLTWFASSCNSSNNAPTQPAKSEPQEKSLKVAYIEVDSIMTRYQFAVEYAKILKNKMETIQSTLNSKGMALQKEVADFQNKIQNGQMSQDQAQQAQANLQKKQNQLQNLQESLTNQYQELQDGYNKALHDSIQNFLKSYNKGRGFDFILSKSGDNILYANSALDVTDDVIKGLNKRYTPKGKQEK